MGTVFALLAAAVALIAIIYVWRSVMGGPPLSDGTPGSVLDAGEEVRRIDMGTHGYAAQQASAELTMAGFKTKLVTLEQGAFGIGMGERYYLVYNAVDEPDVRAVVEQQLGDLHIDWSTQGDSTITEES